MIDVVLLFSILFCNLIMLFLQIKDSLINARMKQTFERWLYYTKKDKESRSS